MAKRPDRTALTRSVPSDITEIARLIQSNQIAGWTMQQREDGVVKFHGVSPGGDTILIEKKAVAGYSRTITETTSKPGSIKARRKLVRELRKEGMTQSQIALRVGVSQKTISNDCSELDI